MNAQLRSQAVARTAYRPERLALALLCLALLSAACGAERPVGELPAIEPIAERDARGSILIRWDSAPENARIEIFADTAPDARSRTQPVGFLEQGAATVSGLVPEVRHYFALVPSDGSETRIVAERLLPLEGTHNFRDLGGYRTRDGRSVRWGALYRSDSLGELTGADLDYLEMLGIRLVCDFRGPQEVEEEPDPLPESGSVQRINPGISDESFSPDRMKDALLSGNPDGIDFGNLLVEGNRYFALESLAQYRTFFRSLESPHDTPRLFNCTAGKDRTGFAAALVLSALGVDERTVMNDYMLSKYYSADHIESTLRLVRFVSFFRTDPEEIRPLLSVREAYLQAALDSIMEKYGSLDVYLRDALGVSDEALAALRERFLY
jgi:protein-tyrosine phosphatase